MPIGQVKISGQQQPKILIGHPPAPVHHHEREERRLDIQDLQAQALRIRDLYDEFNHQERNRVWTREEFLLGFVGDVGDLAKLVMAAEGARDMPGGRAALGHELADCLWAVLVLAHLYDVDLPAEFTRTMSDLERDISARLRPRSEG